MIHTNRIVTVGRTRSAIDKPIVLYRGDREVEVEFTLAGNAFTFSEEGNVIKSVNASHGQLVLNTPSGEHMFSELAECHEGKVVFVITKEMIDEFIETGFYSFQIRLYDSAEMKSRVTIPPVMNGFDIRNPIAAEDETNVVDQGAVDYARVSKDQSNEELPTFDWQGNYNKTEWTHHDVITENKMNKIEDALYSINANIKESDVVILNTLEQVKKDADKYVKEHMAEVEADVDEFERNINTNVQQFKIDTNAAMTAHKNEVSEVLDGFSSQLADIENKSYVSVTDFGAVGDANYYNDNDDKYYVDAKFTTLATDCTKAFKEALQVSTSIKLPKGNFWVTEPLNIPSKQLDFFGDGMSVSAIVFTGLNDLFTTTSSLLRVCFRDFSCTGTMATSGSCFNFPKNCTLHRSVFKNLILYSGDSCIYCGYDFSTLFENVHVWSRRGHGFDIQGRNSTVLLNCYAHQIDGVGKSGYRIYNYATLIGCNGLDSGETWGIFGGTQSEDGMNYYSCITLNGCNLEDFSSKALLIKSSGKMNIIGCKFDSSPDSTYEHYIYAPNSNVEFTLIGNKDISSSRASISHILSKHDYGDVFVSGSDIKTVTSRTYNLTTIYDKSTGKTSCVLPSTGIIYRIGRTVVLEEGSYSVGRVVDNNKMIGDELKIIVNCEDISLKNAVMGVNSDQSIITKDGSNRKLSKGEVVKLAFNGTNWIEI